MKCGICKKKIETTFLDKIMGTQIKIDKTIKYVCSECQSKVKDLKKELK